MTPPTEPCLCLEMRQELRDMRRELTSVRVRMGWLFGGLAALGVLDFLPACQALPWT